MTELRESLLQDLQYIASYVADTDQTPALEPIADAIMARFAIDRPAPVVVKDLELEWEDDGCHCWRADTPFGPYMIRKWGHPRIDYGWWPAFDDGAEAEDVGSHEVAKAACQADYTRRILSAVNAVSEAQVEADGLAAMRGVVEAAWRVDACEDPEAEETAHAFDDLRKRLVALDALTKAEG